MNSVKVQSAKLYIRGISVSYRGEFLKYEMIEIVATFQLMRNNFRISVPFVLLTLIAVMIAMIIILF